MAIARELTCTRGSVRRTYNVWYENDPPEREEAVRFFGSPHKLFPAMDLPPVVHEMTLENANAYLGEHPIPRLYRLLTVQGPIADDDLERLRYLPELKILQIFSDVSDQGIAHLRQIKALDRLVVYSERVTSACLSTVAELTTLRLLDMQASPHVSPIAFAAVASRLPKLQDSWPPLSPGSGV